MPIIILLDVFCLFPASCLTQDVFLRYTFDNICVIGFGTDPEALSPDFPEVPFVKALDRATQHSTARAIQPSSAWKCMRALGVGAEAQFLKDLRILDDFVDAIITKRRAETRRAADIGVGEEASKKGAQYSDLLWRMIFLGEKDHGELFDDRFLRDACLNFIIAGRDTSATAMTWLMWELSQHPEIQDKILDEVRRVLSARGDGSLGLDQQPFSFAELKELKYTHAVINETLRLHPPVPVDSKTAAADDTLPGGTKVGKGWRVTYNIYAVGRMTRVWGADAREFKPERWLAEDGNVLVESPFKFPVFNAGPRLCLGREMAYLQVKSVVSYVLLKYRLELVPDFKVAYKLGITLFMKDGLLMKVLPRETVS